MFWLIQIMVKILGCFSGLNKKSLLSPNSKGHIKSDK